MGKIWIAYTLSIHWMLWLFADAIMRDVLSHANNVLLGAIIADFIIATIPLWITLGYDRIKKREKLKHAILKR
jgi:hypothetical protein